MNTNFKTNHSDKISRQSIVSIRGDISHRVGNVRAMTVEGKVRHTERTSRASPAISARNLARNIESFYGNDRSSLIHEGKIAMYEHAARLQQLLVTWVLIADGKRAQIYECRKTVQKIPLGGVNIHHYYDEKSGHGLVPVPNGVMESESIDDYQTGHDRRGTASSSNSSTHNTYEPHGDIAEELKQRFTRTIAGKLQNACADNLFDRLVLVAPARMISELRGRLSPAVQDRIVATVSKDLTPLSRPDHHDAFTRYTHGSSHHLTSNFEREPNGTNRRGHFCHLRITRRQKPP